MINVWLCYVFAGWRYVERAELALIFSILAGTEDAIRGCQLCSLFDWIDIKIMYSYAQNGGSVALD